MRKRMVQIFDVPAGGVIPALLVVSVAFMLGGLFGCLMAAQVDGGGGDSLTAYIQSYLQAVQAGLSNPPSLLFVIWETIRWPLFTVLMSFTSLGIVGVPVLFSVRGFLISFAVAAFVRMFGAAGGVLAFFAFGLTGLVAVPVLFVLGVQAFIGAQGLVGHRFLGYKRLFGRIYFVRLGLCAIVLMLCVLMEYLAVPALLRMLAAFF